MRKIKRIIQSSGGVLWDDKKDLIFIIAHKQHGFVLPKGRREKGEELLDTAKREIREETGYDVSDAVSFLGKVKYSVKARKIRYPKEVYYYVFKVNQDSIKHELMLEAHEKVGEGVWVGPLKAKEMLNFKTDKNLVEKFIDLEESLKLKNDKI